MSENFLFQGPFFTDQFGNDSYLTSYCGCGHFHMKWLNSLLTNFELSYAFVLFSPILLLVLVYWKLSSPKNNFRCLHYLLLATLSDVWTIRLTTFEKHIRIKYELPSKKYLCFLMIRLLKTRQLFFKFKENQFLDFSWHRKNSNFRPSRPSKAILNEGTRQLILATGNMVFNGRICIFKNSLTVVSKLMCICL